MEPSHASEPPPHHDQLSALRLHELLKALTVISDQAQLLQRQVRKNQQIDPDVLLGRLDVIDQMVNRIVAELEFVNKGADSTMTVDGTDEPH